MDLPPGIEYNGYQWVLVKLKDRDAGELTVPRIAMFDARSEYWIGIDNSGIYAKEYRREVIAWKPISGTKWEDLYQDGEKVMRVYTY